MEFSAQRPYLLPAVESRQEKAGKMQIGRSRNIGSMVCCPERGMAAADRHLSGGRRVSAGKDRNEYDK